MTDIVEMTSERLGGVTSARMEGDNLAILLCGVFENHTQEVDDETGWTPDAVTGCDEVLDAIREHYRPLADTIEQLRARIAELEGELVQQQSGSAPMDVERIAAGLSRAQRLLLFALDPVEYRDWKALSRNVRTRNKLATLGLVMFDDSGPVVTYFKRRLSPLGLAVRQHLIEKGL